jgi:hypothetical protein
MFTLCNLYSSRQYINKNLIISMSNLNLIWIPVTKVNKELLLIKMKQKNLIMMMSNMVTTCYTEKYIFNL